MSTRLAVRVVIDVGRTNKKILVFDEEWNCLREQQVSIPDTVEPNGTHLLESSLLVQWMHDAVADACHKPEWNVLGINFSGYGATLVHLDAAGKLVIPPEDYLDPFPEHLVSEFSTLYGSREITSLETASPWLGNLNSGLQLFRLKRTAPDQFARIAVTMHLPQWLSWQFTKVAVSDLTSVGCHTMLWNFRCGEYHHWVKREGIDRLLAPLGGGLSRITLHGTERVVGSGLHDSSAALIPYMVSNREPFLLISTGTWSISLNSFNNEPLTVEELQKDCLCYLTRDGRQVKAARYFIGPEHEIWIKRIGERFNCEPSLLTSMRYDSAVDNRAGVFDDPLHSATVSEAYHCAMALMMKPQAEAIRLAAGLKPPKLMLVDGGFARNAVYMGILARCFPNCRVEAAIFPQASALGAAMAMRLH